MNPSFAIQSSDPDLLAKARRIANNNASSLICDDLTGIVLLGAVVRGYFDEAADIDIAVYKRPGSQFAIPEKFFKIEEIELHIWLSDFENERTSAWDMAKRWTFSLCQVVHDPSGEVARLIAAKVPLQADERRWLLMSGLVLSEWYINRLTELWLQRGDPLSAQAMFQVGLEYFYEMLFGLNDSLVPDRKWRTYCVQRLRRLPADFSLHLQETLLLHEISTAEQQRRKAAFMAMWRELQPTVEAEVGMSFDEMVELV